MHGAACVNHTPQSAYIPLWILPAVQRVPALSLAEVSAWFPLGEVLQVDSVAAPATGCAPLPPPFPVTVPVPTSGVHALPPIRVAGGVSGTGQLLPATPLRTETELLKRMAGVAVEQARSMARLVNEARGGGDVGLPDWVSRPGDACVRAEMVLDGRLVMVAPELGVDGVAVSPMCLSVGCGAECSSTAHVVVGDVGGAPGVLRSGVAHVHDSQDATALGVVLGLLTAAVKPETWVDAHMRIAAGERVTSSPDPLRCECEVAVIDTLCAVMRQASHTDVRGHLGTGLGLEVLHVATEVLTVLVRMHLLQRVGAGLKWWSTAGPCTRPAPHTAMLAQSGNVRKRSLQLGVGIGSSTDRAEVVHAPPKRLCVPMSTDGGEGSDMASGMDIGMVLGAGAVMVTGTGTGAGAGAGTHVGLGFPTGAGVVHVDAVGSGLVHTPLVPFTPTQSPALTLPVVPPMVGEEGEDVTWRLSDVVQAPRGPCPVLASPKSAFRPCTPPGTPPTNSMFFGTAVVRSPHTPRGPPPPPPGPSGLRPFSPHTPDGQPPIGRPCLPGRALVARVFCPQTPPGAPPPPLPAK